MTLIHPARLKRHDLSAYLKDMLTRLPTQKASTTGRGAAAKLGTCQQGVKPIRLQYIDEKSHVDETLPCAEVSEVRNLKRVWRLRRGTDG
ncbi:TPA: hypothetical protein L4W69_005682 [Pseudomonas aeruginosa]|nr:hypothetical protein [Pseudomonas aeruginosa]HEK1310986.1 hypothetical protein [Pseudomonas aeruginosa]